ncbi:MAG: hypothetical protein IJL87_05165, partial [Clostridia bacterium]|nr:hypothetical protein [Clostridia bacterium]
MLNLLLGPAGAGKTTHLLDICDAAAEKGGEVIYIVPEQASFDAERRILQQLGEKKAILCEVLSFTRLCHRIMRTYGRIASARLSESGKAALMSRAVDSVRDYLKVYSSSGRKTDTVKIMLDAVAEFKSRAVTPEIIENAAAVEKDSMLGKRLFDMSLIYSAYNALLAETGIDPSDLPFIACDVLGSNNFFADITVIIDSFKSFTPGEEQLLKKILGGSKEVWVSLCCDSLDDPAGGFGLFSPVKETAERVLKFAREVGTPAASPVILNDSVRYRSPALRALEKGIYPYGNFEVFADPTEDVNLTECADPSQGQGAQAVGLHCSVGVVLEGLAAPVALERPQAVRA